MMALPMLSFLLSISPVACGADRPAELAKSYEEIENCIRSKDFVEAQRLWNRLDRHSLSPNDSVLLYQHARIAVGSNKGKEAIEAYTKLIEVVPYRAYPYLGRGQLYLNNKEFDKAIADFNEAVKIAPGSPIGHFRRAEAYYGKANDSVSPTVAETNLEASIRDVDNATKLLGDHMRKLRDKDLSFTYAQEKLEFDVLTRRQLELRERLDASLQRELNNLDDPEEEETPGGEGPDGKKAKPAAKPDEGGTPDKDAEGAGKPDDGAAPAKDAEETGKPKKGAAPAPKANKGAGNKKTAPAPKKDDDGWNEPAPAV
jgi:tetratricopeptide (TPR) repeat protein